MSDPFAALRPYWYVSSLERVGSYQIVKLLHRTKNTRRIAYHVAGETRCHLTPEMSDKFADTMMNEVRRDRQRSSNKPTGFLHMVRIYTREAMPSRWQSHRKRMERKKEERQLVALPHFGMF